MGQVPEAICSTCFTFVETAMAAALPIFLPCLLFLFSLLLSPSGIPSIWLCHLSECFSFSCVPLKNQGFAVLLWFGRATIRVSASYSFILFESDVVTAIQKVLKNYGCYFGYICCQEIRQCQCWFSEPQSSCHKPVIPTLLNFLSLKTRLATFRLPPPG